jgi:hypothetical protein
LGSAVNGCGDFGPIAHIPNSSQVRMKKWELAPLLGVHSDGGEGFNFEPVHIRKIYVNFRPPQAENQLLSQTQEFLQKLYTDSEQILAAQKKSTVTRWQFWLPRICPVDL